MSNIKRTVERENLSAVFFCEFFHSKIVYMEEKIREEQGLVPELKYKYQLKVNGRYAESALTMKYAEGKAMIIIGEKLNGSIPSVAKAIVAGKSIWVKVYSGEFEDWIRNVDRIVKKYGSHSLFLLFPEMSMEQAVYLLDYAERNWSDVKGTFVESLGR